MCPSRRFILPFLNCQAIIGTNTHPGIVKQFSKAHMHKNESFRSFPAFRHRHIHTNVSAKKLRRLGKSLVCVHARLRR